MGFIEEYHGIMNVYREEVQKVQQKKRFFDGVLGLGTHPGSAACHEIMDQQVEALCDRAAAEADAAEKAELTEAILQAAVQWKGPEYARLMLVATQRHTLKLIPTLEAEKKESLRAWFEQEFPRRMRLPVQDQVLKMLKGK